MGRRGTTIVLRYVHHFKDHTNVDRYYFRRNGKRTPLPGLPMSREFQEAYAAALESKPLPEPEREKPGTLRALATKYYGTPKFLRMAESSRGNYRRVLDRFLEAHGHRLVAQMKREHLESILGEMVDRPGAAIVLHKRLRTLLDYGVKIGWIGSNPASRIETYKSDEFHTWTEEEIAEFEKRWPIGTKQRLAFALLLYTGQRGSDVHRMMWPNENGLIRITQKKTGTQLDIPVHPALASILSAAKREHLVILVTEYGQPFSVKGFGQFMSAAISAAGLADHCKAHGLRKAMARRLAEHDATTKQIAAVTGHLSLSEIEKYTRKAAQGRLAAQGMNKIGKSPETSLPISPNDE